MSEPLVLSDSLVLYSGDIITLNSQTFLVEVVDSKQRQIKLRKP